MFDLIGENSTRIDDEGPHRRPGGLPRYRHRRDARFAASLDAFFARVRRTISRCCPKRRPIVR
jgi:hypothetical protein